MVGQAAADYNGNQNNQGRTDAYEELIAQECLTAIGPHAGRISQIAGGNVAHPPAALGEGGMSHFLSRLSPAQRTLSEHFITPVPFST